MNGAKFLKPVNKTNLECLKTSTVLQIKTPIGLLTNRSF